MQCINRMEGPRPSSSTPLPPMETHSTLLPVRPLVKFNLEMLSLNAVKQEGILPKYV